MQEPDRARIIEAGHWTRIMYALQRIKFVITHGLALRELRAHLRHKTEKPQEKRLPKVSESEITGSPPELRTR